MTTGSRFAMATLLLFVFSSSSHAENAKLKVLIIDGQNNHDWKATTPILRRALADCGRFTVDRATAPGQGKDMAAFRPEFAAYDAVVSNYNGDPWSQETKQAFVDYVQSGGGFVLVHAADNAFPNWSEYNTMIGLAGWGGRDERAGPYVYFQNGKLVRDDSPGPCGYHGQQHEFQIVVREANHPITQDMPTRWMHTQDELYDQLRGPATKMTVLATAFSDPAKSGTGRDEPILWTVDYGRGRIFHTVLGHADYSMNCIGFITTLQRGTEWAATGQVTVEIPDNFPAADKVSVGK